MDTGTWRPLSHRQTVTLFSWCVQPFPHLDSVCPEMKVAIQIPPLSSVCDSNLSLSLTHESEIDISQSSLVPWENQESGCENGLCWEAQGAQSWVAQSLRTLTLLPRGWLFLISEDRKHVVLIHTHTCTHTRAHTQMHTYVHKCTQTSTDTCTHTNTQKDAP